MNVELVHRGCQDTACIYLGCYDKFTDTSAPHPPELRFPDDLRIVSSFHFGRWKDRNWYSSTNGAIYHI